MMRLLLDTQLASLFLFWQLPTSLMDVVSASPQLVLLTLSGFFRLKLNFVFVTRLLLVSHLWRLGFAPFGISIRLSISTNHHGMSATLLVAPVR